jgi:PAS domain S-box-containing protein
MIGYNQYLGALIGSAVISGALVIFFWRRLPAAGVVAMSGLVGMTLVWSVGYIVEVMANSLSDFQAANDIEYIGIAFIPVLWFIFAIQYTRLDNWLSRRLYLLFIIPLITLVLVWTNYLHGWMWYNAQLQIFGQFIVQIKTYGPWFWVHTAYSYILLFSGVGIISSRLFHSHHLYRNQTVLLLIAIILPLIWNVIYVLRAPPTYNIDMTPPAFAVSGLIIALGLFRFDIFKIVPIARNIVVDNMNDSVFVLDVNDNILDLNKAAEAIAGKPAAQLIGKPVDRGLEKQSDLQKYIHNHVALQTEISINVVKNLRNFEMLLAPLYDQHQRLLGRVLTLHDITERKRMENSLRDYTRRVTQVQEEERKRIAYELHDDTSQYLSILKLQINSLLRSEKIQDPETLEKLRFLEKDASRAADIIRRYSHELRPSVLEHLGLRAALEQIAEDHNKLGQMTIGLEVEGPEPALPEEVKLGLFRIAQEALNNTRKHSRATRATLRLQFNGKLVRMSVNDNGTGFDIREAYARAGKKGSLGLTSMQERASIIGATLKLESEVGKGTTVTAEVQV